MVTNNSSNVSTLVGAAREMNFPLQPAFIAYNSAPVAGVSGDSTVYTCVFDTEFKDQGGHFAANTFTAPVTGKYLLGTNIKLTNLGAGHTELILSIVTTGRTYEYIINCGTLRSSDNIYSASINTLALMTATDTAYVTIKISNSTKTVGYYGGASPDSLFYGYLVI